jgi:L-lactate utilization protein LutC
MNIFKKLFKFKEPDQESENEVSKFMPESKLPIDDMFLNNFKKNGGKFLYCENEEELQDTFHNILSENNWINKPCYYYSNQTAKRFEAHDVEFSKDNSAEFFISNCEYLIGNTGAILISSKQIGDKKLEDLPYHFIVTATTSQLLETIGEGLTRLKSKYKNSIPSNITTLKTFEKDNNDKSDFLSYGSTTKNLYLLLLEDL